ncbi:MAG: cardiolipin synthase ClsB, partial [Candidatus Accumulibacter sp.]|nr:cardiolipin synthase ClsB [Accumulibacter sp.]
MTARFLPGNRLTLLNSGAEYFPALIGAIDGARHEVHLESYIFEDDGTGRAVAEAMARAARRGVAVRVLVDGF